MTSQESKAATIVNEYGEFYNYIGEPKGSVGFVRSKRRASLSELAR